MKLIPKIVLLISFPLLLNAQSSSVRGFSIEVGGAFLHNDTYFDMSIGEQLMEDTYYGGIDFGVSYQLSSRHTVSLFSNLYIPLEGHWGIGFCYGNKSRFAMGPIITFTESLYEPSLGGELFVKKFYLRGGVSRYDLSEENRERYKISYGNKTWVSIGYSFGMKRLNRRLFN